MSVKEALLHAAGANQRKLEIKWIASDELEKGKHMEDLEDLDAMIVPGGFGYRGIEGKILAARYARMHNVPYLGLCLGMQVMCIEFARNVLNYEDANSTEFDEGSPFPIISLMTEQQNVTTMGGTMRLGEYPCQLEPGSVAAATYGQPEIMERHRHRFEFNNEYRDTFVEHGMRFSGLSPDETLVEIAEIKNHPYMLGSQFHPEFLSRPNRPHPLFMGLVKAAIAYQKQKGKAVAQPVAIDRKE
jgi:CTP synthase